MINGTEQEGSINENGTILTPEGLGFTQRGHSLVKEIHGESYEISPLETIEKLEEAVQLQQEVWGFVDRDVCPSHMWVTAKDTGGHVLGARDSSGKLIAFIAGFGGYDVQEDHSFVLSDMLGVSEEQRDGGIGFNLKLAQALYVANQGIGEIRWTYDPLRSRNAYLNLRKLGAVVTKFFVDKYGNSLEGEQNAEVSDRFLVRWFINDPQIQDILINGRSSVPQDGIPTAEADHMPDTPVVSAHIPFSFDGLSAEDIRAEQLRFRSIASTYITDRGYKGVDYYLGEVDGARKGFYIFSKSNIIELDAQGGDMKQKEEFFANLDSSLHVFEGCQNMLGVVSLTQAGYDGDEDSWIKDERLRRLLVEWGRQINSDSVMVLTGDPLKADQQGYHVTMDVLEPRGGNGSDLGGISTMCGNGVRAVAAYVKEFLPDIEEVTVMTLSGLRKIKIEKGSNEEDLFVVDMGEFSDKSDDLARYAKLDRVPPNSDGKYLDSEIPEEIKRELEGVVDVNSWSIGINGDRNGDGKMDGEPHLVVEIPRDRVKDIADLRKIAVVAGPIITKHLDLFPEEMNANFIVVDGVDEEGRFVIWNCTHERNLGDDPDHSVTASCGTGSTVAGGIMFEKYVSDPTQVVLVKCTGGDLEIAKSQTSNSLLMKGPAQRVNQAE